MQKKKVVERIESTASNLDRKEKEPHFRWASILKFLCFGYTYSSSSNTYDLFSRVVHDYATVYGFIILEIFIGITFMCMDVFIRQYTRKLDFNSNLNPILKAISLGALLQTILWTLFAIFLSDTLRFLTISFQSEPTWSSCQVDINISCLDTQEVLFRCRSHNVTSFNSTSAHVHYLRAFTQVDSAVVTTKSFVIGLVWICNFLLTTLADETLLKFFQASAILRMLSTVIISLIIMYSADYYVSTAFSQLLHINSLGSLLNSLDRITCAFGVGFVGLYDLGTLSPYTVIDNTVGIFGVVFTVFGILRSLIVRILYLSLTKCVKIEINVTTHYLFFALLPLSTELMYSQKLYIIYIYTNMVFALIACLVLLTLTMARLLSSEFRAVKNIYILGILCFLGFSFSLPIAVSKVRTNVMAGLMTALNVVALYLGGCKTVIVLWIYGVRRFSDDIHFHLGFRPTKFWTICWTSLPVVLCAFFIRRTYELTQMVDLVQMISAYTWIAFTSILVIFSVIKIFSKYLLRNNISRLCRSSPKYGPLDPEDRKLRILYDETHVYYHRQCRHGCIVLDDSYECNHLPLILIGQPLNSLSSEEGLTPIYEAPGTSGVCSSVFNLDRNV